MIETDEYYTAYVGIVDTEFSIRLRKNKITRELISTARRKMH